MVDNTKVDKQRNTPVDNTLWSTNSNLESKQKENIGRLGLRDRQNYCFAEEVIAEAVIVGFEREEDDSKVVGRKMWIEDRSTL